MRRREFWTRLQRNRMAMTGLALVMGLFVVSIGAPWLAPYNPDHIELTQVLMPPSPAHLMGTDTLGRDVLSRIIYGSRVSLKVGFVAVGLATLIGLFVGALAGYYGGWVDQGLMRLVDVGLAIPRIFVLLLVVAFWERIPLGTLVLIIGFTGWFATSRLVRAEALSIRERPFSASSMFSR